MSEERSCELSCENCKHSDGEKCTHLFIKRLWNENELGLSNQNRLAILCEHYDAKPEPAGFDEALAKFMIDPKFAIDGDNRGWRDQSFTAGWDARNDTANKQAMNEFLRGRTSGEAAGRRNMKASVREWDAAEPKELRASLPDFLDSLDQEDKP